MRTHATRSPQTAGMDTWLLSSAPRDSPGALTDRGSPMRASRAPLACVRYTFLSVSRVSCPR